MGAQRVEHTRSDKEKEALKNELMRLKKVVAAAETTLKNYQSEVSSQGEEPSCSPTIVLRDDRFFRQVDKLNHIISEADAERYRQQREYDVVINERDILGTQVWRTC